MAAMMAGGKGRIDTVLRALVWGGAAFLLLLPAIAMRFTTEVDWDETDFIVMGVILALTAGACEFVLRMSSDWTYRIAYAIAIGAAFLMVWSNLAVGIIGNENNPANLMFFGILFVLVVGAIAVRSRADGMAIVLTTVVGLFALANVAAELFGLGSVPWIPIAIFIGLWSASAFLFRLAAGAEAARSR